MECLGKKEWILIYIGLAAVIVIALVLLGILMICIVWPQVVHALDHSPKTGYNPVSADPIVSLPTARPGNDVTAVIALLAPERNSRGDPGVQNLGTIQS